VKKHTKVSLGVVLLLLLGLLVGVGIWVRASTTDPYPKSPEAWNVWLEDRLEASGRTRGENWDVWLDTHSVLGRWSDRLADGGAALDASEEALLAETLDELAGIDLVTPLYEIYPSYDQFELLLDDTGDTREVWLELIKPRLADAMVGERLGEAAAWVRRAEGLRNPLKGSGTIIGFLLEVSIITDALQSVRDGLIESPVRDEAGLSELQRAVGEIASGDPDWVFGIEAALGLPFVAEIARSSWPQQSRAQIGDFERFMADAAAAADDPDASARVEALATRLDEGGVFAVRRAALDMLMPAIGRLWIQFAALDMERDGTVLLIALQRHRVEHGAYPDTLDALVPAYIDELPADGFAPDGRFVYRVLDAAAETPAGGFLLYSVGADGVDHGGATNPRNRIGSTNDSVDYSFTHVTPPEQTEADDDDSDADQTDTPVGGGP